MLAIGCASDSTTCRDEAEPVTVTGLAGVLDGTTPAVELLLLDPVDCAVLRRRWAYFDPATRALTLGAAPSSGVLEGSGVTSTERTLTFTDFDLEVRLEYATASGAATALTLVFADAGGEAARIHCDGVSDWTCQLEP